MAKVLISENILQDMADAIREKTGGEEKLKPSSFPVEVNSIPTGDPELDASFAAMLDTSNGTNCTKLPDSLTVIKDNTFYSSKTGVAINKLPSNLQTIGQNAFRSCSKITIETMPDTITSIGQYAFYGCSKMPLKNLSKGLTRITSYAFASCTNLAIEEIPDSVTIIDSYAFNNCKNMPLKKLPENLTSIGDYSFQSTQKIEVTKIPDSVTDIKTRAFNSSTIPLRELSSSLKTLGSNAFGGCDNIIYLDTVSTVLSSIDSIALQCMNMTTIIFRAPTPPTLNSMAFNDAKNFTIYVPDDYVSKYKSATNWSTYASKIKGLSELPAE